MDTTVILGNLAKYVQLSPGDQHAFTSRLEPRKIRRKDFLLHEGEICTHSTFVTAGCLRSYIFDQNGYEHILQFAPAEWWIADMASYITGQPGNLNIDALMDTEVLMLSKSAQLSLFEECPHFERFFRIITEKSLVTHQRRLLENLSLSAPERFERFCQRYPTLIKTLPQKQIAAYLGVTPEFFSKMRKVLSRKP